MLEVNKIVAVGSVDGILTTAAAVRNFVDVNQLNHSGHPIITWTQAFQVGEIRPRDWVPRSNVLLIGLAVNNRDENMTIGFVERVLEAGHNIVGICDEHDEAAWRRVCDATELVFEELVIQPKTRNRRIGSSGAVLLEHLLCDADDHTFALCACANEADKGNFVGLGSIVNKCIKPAMNNNARRTRLAMHFGYYTDINKDDNILPWLAEGELMEADTMSVVRDTKSLGSGMCIASTLEHGSADVTTVMMELYNHYDVVVVRWNRWDNLIVSSIGVPQDSSIDVLQTLRSSGIDAWGMPSKATVRLEDELAARNAIAALIS
jgi:hypothetical protein